ncbi:MAG TPA: OstA-like protein [Hanamia sp.]
MSHLVKYLCLILLISTGYISFAQAAARPFALKDSISGVRKDTIMPAPKDTITEFQIIKGPSMRAIKIDSVTTLQTIAGGAIIRQGSILFNSDSAVINSTTHVMEAFGNIDINQADTVHTYGQYLKYLSIEKMAYLKNKVRLVNKSGSLYTDDLDYNLGTGIGNYHNGGKVIQGKTTITSLEGTYYNDTKDLYFKKNVKLDDPEKQIRTDSLAYNMQTHQSSFISPTTIKTPTVEIQSSQGSYDLNTGNAFFTSRTNVKDSSGRLYSANSMALESKSGNAQLEGNAVIIDSAAGFNIIANQIFINKNNNSFLATRKPVLMIKQKDDSTYIAADTIYSGFTSFIKNKNEVLNKDSVANFNPKENKKVEETILKDSTLVPRHIVTNEDSTRKVSINDSSEIIGHADLQKSSEDTSLKEITPAKKMDSTQLIETVSVKDTLLKKIPATKVEIRSVNDSPQKEIASNIHKNFVVSTPDSARKEIYLKEKNIDSAALMKDGNISDSLKSNMDTSKLLHKKDTTNKSDTAIRYFLAFHHVKIFNDSLQAVCDSMFISSKDSAFRLYYSPVAWSGNTQISGDTIFLYTKDKQPSRMYAFEQSLIVNETREGFFNQMSGKTINAYFIDGKLDYVRVKGTQAESIYYMQTDDSSYLGMNRATGDVIDIYFKNGELNKVVYINQIDGTMYPMNKIPDDQKKLKTFQWLDSRRPKNKAELFE